MPSARSRPVKCTLCLVPVVQCVQNLPKAAFSKVDSKYYCMLPKEVCLGIHREEQLRVQLWNKKRKRDTIETLDENVTEYRPVYVNLVELYSNNCVDGCSDVIMPAKSVIPVAGVGSSVTAVDLLTKRCGRMERLCSGKAAQILQSQRLTGQCSGIVLQKLAALLPNPNRRPAPVTVSSLTRCMVP